jgi:hypothetical protein
MEQNRNHPERGRIDFERRVVSYLRDNKPLPARNGSVGLSEEFSLKWDILRTLQNGEVERAETLWKTLARRSPLLYGPKFSCLVDSESRTIFFTFLSQLLRNPKPETKVPELTGRLGALHRLLSESPTPLRKEDLIEKIWGKPYDPTLDARFYKLVERLKKATEHTIVTMNRTYSYGTKDAA